jgi:hypothetical protein
VEIINALRDVKAIGSRLVLETRSSIKAQCGFESHHRDEMKEIEYNFNLDELIEKYDEMKVILKDINKSLDKSKEYTSETIKTLNKIEKRLK